MVESLAVYAIVAGAAGWAAWSLGLKGIFRRASAKRAAACDDDCGCGQ